MEHARLLRRFRQTLLRLGCDHFEVYEQVGTNWNTGETTGRFVQIMRFRDRKHQLGVQAAERSDPTAQALVREFCELINFPYQQQQGLFAVGFYTSFLRMPPQRTTTATSVEHSESDEHAGDGNEGASMEQVDLDSENQESEDGEQFAHGQADGNGAGHLSQGSDSPDFDAAASLAEDDQPTRPQ
jgi:hypothetical protein